jgi:ribosome-binding protein aMBF1 (putative translation factor)
MAMTFHVSGQRVKTAVTRKSYIPIWIILQSTGIVSGEPSAWIGSNPRRETRMLSTHNPLYIEFVSKLRAARLAKGLNQTELGALLSKPQAFISKVETCERRLDLVEAAEWCRALDVSLYDILPNELHPVRVGRKNQAR